MKRFGFFPRTRLDRFRPEYSKVETKKLTGQLPKRARTTNMLESRKKQRLANKEFMYNQDPAFKTNPLAFSLLKNAAKSGNPNYLDTYRGVPSGSMTNTDKRNMYKWKNSKEFKDLQKAWEQRQEEQNVESPKGLDLINIQYNKRWDDNYVKKTNTTNETQKKTRTYNVSSRNKTKTSNDEDEAKSPRKTYNL